MDYVPHPGLLAPVSCTSSPHLAGIVVTQLQLTMKFHGKGLNFSNTARYGVILQFRCANYLAIVK